LSDLEHIENLHECGKIPCIFSEIAVILKWGVGENTLYLLSEGISGVVFMPPEGG